MALVCGEPLRQAHHRRASARSLVACWKRQSGADARGAFRGQPGARQQFKISIATRRRWLASLGDLRIRHAALIPGIDEIWTVAEWQ
jgi:hypothetical protein